MTKKTAFEAVIAYLNRCKRPKNQAQIAAGAKVNPNTLRRILGWYSWAPVNKRNGDKGWVTQDCKPELWRIASDNGYRYAIAR